MFQKITKYLLVDHRLATSSATALFYIIVIIWFFPGLLSEDGNKQRPITFATPNNAERVTTPPQSCSVKGFPPKIYCEGPKPSRLEVKSVKNLLPNLSEGQFIYNRIQTMWRGVPETVLLKLNLASETMPTLPKALSGEPKPGLTPVTPEMSVELKGTAGLTVSPSEAVPKRISDLSSTEWQWTVTPTNLAEAELLTLTIYVHVDDDGPFTLKTFEDEIQVKITNWQWAKDTVGNITPIWAFVVGAIPVFWGSYAWLRDRKWRKSKKEWQPFSVRKQIEKDRKKIK